MPIEWSIKLKKEDIEGESSARQISRRQLLQQIGFWGVSLFLAACRAAPSLPQTSRSADIEAGSIVYHTRERAMVWTQDVIDAFHLAQEQVRVTLDTVADGLYSQHLLTLAAGDELGNCYWGNAFTPIYTLAETGIALDMTPILSTDNDLERDQFFPALLGQATHQGRIFGLPISGNPGWSTLYCNLDSLQGYGLSLPALGWRWEEEFLAMARELAGFDQAAGLTDHFGLEFQSNMQNSYTLIRSWGGDWLDAEGRQSTVLAEETVAALAFQRALVAEWGISPQADQVQVNHSFAEGKVAMWNHGIWMRNQIKRQINERFPVHLSPAPSGPGGRGGFVNCDTLCINQRANQPRTERISESINASLAWAKWLLSDEIQLEAWDRYADFPSLPALMTHPHLAQDPDVSGVVAWLNEVQPWTIPANLRILEFRNAFTAQLPHILNPERNFMDEMVALDAGLQEVLDKMIL